MSAVSVDSNDLCKPISFFAWTNRLMLHIYLIFLTQSWHDNDKTVFLNQNTSRLDRELVIEFIIFPGVEMKS